MGKNGFSHTKEINKQYFASIVWDVGVRGVYRTLGKSIGN